MNILYIGPDSGTCRQRRHALERLGHEVFAVDPTPNLPFANRIHAWSFKTGALGLETLTRWRILSAIGDRRFDLVLVDNGEMIGPALVRALKTRARATVLFNLDHPFSGRDGARWRLVHKALGLYDLFATPRQSSADAARRAGVRRVMQMDFAADAFVLPSHQENFGIAVAEAMACSLPVLVSDKVNIWREIDQWKGGLVAADDLAGTISLLERWKAMTPAEIETMRAKALACFDANFDMQVSSARMIDLLATDAALRAA